MILLTYLKYMAASVVLALAAFFGIYFFGSLAGAFILWEKPFTEPLCNYMPLRVAILLFMFIGTLAFFGGDDDDDDNNYSDDYSDYGY